MTNKLNRSDYLILDTLHGSNMTDQFHSMTIEEIMEETRAKLGSLELPEVDITEQKEEPTKKRMTKLELLKKRRGQ